MFFFLLLSTAELKYDVCVCMHFRIYLGFKICTLRTNTTNVNKTAYNKDVIKTMQKCTKCSNSKSTIGHRLNKKILYISALFWNRIEHWALVIYLKNLQLVNVRLDPVCVVDANKKENVCVTL